MKSTWRVRQTEAGGGRRDHVSSLSSAGSVSHFVLPSEPDGSTSRLSCSFYALSGLFSSGCIGVLQISPPGRLR